MDHAYEQLLDRWATIADLNAAGGLLGWDQETYMPPGGAESRALQQATLRTLSHQLLTDPEMGRLLETLRPRLEGLDPLSDEASNIRLAHRDWDRAVRVPADLVREMTEARARGVEAWRAARRDDRFADFAPWLQRGIDLQRRYVACFEPEGNPYDVLLDRHEPGTTQAGIAAVFAELKPRLMALARQAGGGDGGAMRRKVDPAAQMAFSRQVTEMVGFDYGRGRIDLTTHPFCSSTSYRDVRLTTRFDPENLLFGLMASIHECGHGLHAQHMDPGLYRQPATGSSSGIAESQSRLYENNLGRSRAFWMQLLPKLKASLAPVFDDLSLDEAYAAVNHVGPSLIRVQADEVTYGLHIILRFELEDALLNGRLSVDEAPAAWNQKMEESLGIVPPDDTTGILQDIHWSGGGFGYFPDYLLGSVLAAALWQAMGEALPDREADIEAGRFGDILAWSRENVMRWGRKLTIDEVSERATGAPLSPAPYLSYLEGKYAGRS